MPTFRNFKEYEKHINKLLKDSMEEVGAEVEKVLRDRIEKDVYSVYDPKEYERTRELKNSVMHTQAKDVGGNVVVEVGHDTDMIRAYEPNQHMSIDGQDVSEYLPRWINDGTIGNAYGLGKWTDARPYMDNTKEQIKNDNILENELKKSLRKRGVNVK